MQKVATLASRLHLSFKNHIKNTKNSEKKKHICKKIAAANECLLYGPMFYL